jgi:hypothetical protein
MKKGGQKSRASVSLHFEKLSNGKTLKIQYDLCTYTVPSFHCAVRHLLCIQIIYSLYNQGICYRLCTSIYKKYIPLLLERQQNRS